MSEEVQRPAERAVLGAFRVHVDPLVIAGGVGEFVDLFLGDFYVFGDPEIGAGEGIAAAAKIGQFVKEIEGQLGWTTQLPWSASTLEQRRFDALRLLRQVPAITELSQLDASGKEQLRVSRIALDALGSNLDRSQEPAVLGAVTAAGLKSRSTALPAFVPPQLATLAAVPPEGAWPYAGKATSRVRKTIILP